MINDAVKINEVIEAFKALGGSAKSKQIEDYIISSRGNILPKAYEHGGWDSYRKTINQVMQVYCPGYKKYRNKQYFEKTEEGLFKLVGFNELDHRLLIESGLIDTHEAAGKAKINKKEFDKIVNENKLTGEKGELLVIEYEKNRLSSVGRTDLANKIRHIALDSVSEGYDVISFDEAGNKIFIEVKSSRSENDIFYISDNEFTVAKSLRQAYWIYRVHNCFSDFKIIPIQDPYSYVETGQWQMRSINYIIKCTEQSLQPDAE